MIQVFPAHTRNTTDLGWLKSHKNFSFGDYFDEDNVGFGVMRVCNDDDIAAGRGFGPHPHSDMEIVSIVLSGAIKHEDSLGHVAVTGVNGVQRMSAGSGVIHAEYNASDTEPMSLFQLWFMPSKRGLEPSFENVTYEPEAMINTSAAGRYARGGRACSEDPSGYEHLPQQAGSGQRACVQARRESTHFSYAYKREVIGE